MRGFAPLGDGACCPVSDARLRLHHRFRLMPFGFLPLGDGSITVSLQRSLRPSLGADCFVCAVAPPTFLPLGDGSPAILMPAYFLLRATRAHMRIARA